MKMKFILLIVTAGSIIGMTGGALATPLSIYDIQYTTNPTGNSSYATQTVSCVGGIVINKFAGSKPKVTLYDPAHPDGWGGLAIKDWTSSKSFYSTVQIGDWVSFTNVVVEESSGNTQLQFLNSSTYNIDSSGNLLPEALSISTADLAAPIQQTSPTGWFVANHNTEKYEAMYLKLNDVTITAKDLGKNQDNYVLADATASSWASDYMDPDTGGRLYHPLVALGTHFQSVSGICEQYTKSNTTGNSWDYYQLLTTGTGDFVVPEPASCLLFALCLPWAIRRMGKVSSR
ncbi:MAG: hypothetical protein WC765_00155 [Phycisphaerae bacterium]|jgi:predicted extracellular nuclease